MNLDGKHEATNVYTPSITLEFLTSFESNQQISHFTLLLVIAFTIIKQPMLFYNKAVT